MRHPILLYAAAVWWVILPCFVAGRGMDDQTQRRDQQTTRQQQPHDLRRQQQPVPIIHSERIRQTLLEDFDPTSFPWELIWAKNKLDDGIDRGLDVEISINFHKVFEIDVTRSLADFIIWFRLQWKDPRLVWDPTEYGNVTETFYDVSEIWSPDIVLWNLETGIDETLTDIQAKVKYDGTVFWSRPGRLRAVCKLQGLENFPFDQLRCTMEFGSWAYSGKYLRPTLLDGGFDVGNSETSGDTYPEFQIKNISVAKHLYPPFIGSPSEDWPTVLYTVDFKRSVSPYVRGYVVTQCLLNAVGFSAFWLPVASGERLAMPITAILAAVTTELIVASRLPVANIVTWMNKFALGSTLFAFAVVLQSVVVTYFYFHTGTDLKPRWFKWMQEKFQKTDNSDSDPDSDKKFTSERTGTTVSMSEHEEPPQKNANSDFGRAVGGVGNIGVERLNGSNDQQASRVGETSSWMRQRLRKSNRVYSHPSESDQRDHTSNFMSERQEPLEPNATSDFARSVRNSIGNIDIEKLIDFKDQRSSRIGRTRKRRLSLDNLDRKTIDRLSLEDRKTIHLLSKAAIDFKDEMEARNNRKWQQVAVRIDSVSRLVLPTMYVVFVAILFGEANKLKE